MAELDEIKKIPIDTITKMKQINPGRHLSDVLQGLIENSIDALCDEIKIYIENDGLTSIKVIDDGIGIPKSSLPIACRFYSTSKIQEITKTEIVHGKSFGFTGSFLANLSCVSTIKISSRFHKEDKSNYALYEYNVMTKSGESYEIDKGTRVEVLNYLSNFPQQRLKMRKNEKEINKMINTIAKYSIVYSWIKFEVVINDITYLKSQGNADFFTNLAKMHYFQEPLKMFLVNSYENIDQNTEIIAFLANPRYNYMTMNNTILRAVFLNGRLVSVPSIKRVVNDLYCRTMNNFVKMPYFIFIKTSEVYTNDVFDENINEDDLIEESEKSEIMKEEKCYYQKSKYFKFIDKLKQELSQMMVDITPIKESQVLNEVRKLEGRLIGEHLCNPPRLKDINKIFYPLSIVPQNQQQQSQSHQKHREGIQGQSSIPSLQQSTMPNILVQSHPIQTQQTQNQPHSTFIATTRIPTQNLQEQQKQQSQSQSPFLATSRISSQQSLQIDQQNQQVQVQSKATTIHTPKHTVHTVAKSPIVKKSISPATSTVFVSQLQPTTITTTSSSSLREPSSSIASITSPIQTQSQTQSLLNPVSVSSVLNNKDDQKAQKTQIQAPQKSAARVTDINDLLTNNNAAPQQTQQVQKVQAVAKRVMVRKHTTTPITIVSNQNKANSSGSSSSSATGGQQQNNSQAITSNQNQQGTQSSQSNVQTAPVIKIHKIGQPPKPPS